MLEKSLSLLLLFSLNNLLQRQILSKAFCDSYKSHICISGAQTTPKTAFRILEKAYRAVAFVLKGNTKALWPKYLPKTAREFSFIDYICHAVFS